MQAILTVDDLEDLWLGTDVIVIMLLMGVLISLHIDLARAVGCDE